MRHWIMAVLLLLLLPLASAIRVDNLNIVENSAIFTIDKVAPIGNLTHRSTGSDLDTTFPVNVSFFLGDTSIFAANLSHNANGSFVNHSITISGNNTYHYIIGNGNFSGSEVVTYTIYAFDAAGNSFTQSSQFTIDATHSTGGPAPVSGGGGGGAGGFGPCTLESISPKNDAYVEFSPVLADRTMKADITIKNAGGSQGIYYFKVETGEFYKNSCKFTNTQNLVDVGAQLTNAITCSVPDNDEQGTMTVTACGSSITYKLGMDVNKKVPFSMFGGVAGKLNPNLFWFLVAAGVMLLIVSVVGFGILFSKFFKGMFS